MADLVPVVANVLLATGSPVRTVALGAAVTQMQSVYEDGTNGLKLADASALATATLAGITTTAGEIGQDCIIATEGGNINPGVAVVPGTWYVVSAAAPGGVAPEADLLSTNAASLVGLATTTSNIELAFTKTPTVKA